MTNMDKASPGTNHQSHAMGSAAGSTQGKTLTAEIDNTAVKMFQNLIANRDTAGQNSGGSGANGSSGNTSPGGNLGNARVREMSAGRDAHGGANHEGMGGAGKNYDGMNHDGMNHADMSGAPASGSKAPADMVAGLGDLADAQGNVKPANTGQHSGHSGPEMGHMLNVHATYEAASASGIDADAFVKDFVSNNDNYNPGQTGEQKQAGALTALNDMTAARTMGGLDGDPDQLARTSGAATKAALAGDADGLRKILDDAGGNTNGMSDDMLVNTWSTNSHMYNHSILRTGSDSFALTHIRSLNDKAGDGTPRGDLGFYNDKGEYPQWNSQVEAQRFMASQSGKSV